MLTPMSPLDSLFLIGEAPERPLHVGGVQIFQPPEGADARDIRDLLDSATEVDFDDLAPRMAKRPRRTLTTLGQWAWEPDTRIDLGHHFQKEALPGPGGDRELMQLCSRLHSTPLDRSRPLWEMHFIEGLSGGRFAIYTKMHHALADGVTAMKMMRHSMSEDADERGMRAPWQRRSPEESATPDGPGRGIRLVDLPGTAVRTGLNLLGEVAGTVPAFADTVSRAVRDLGGAMSVSAPATMLNVPISQARNFSAR
ncbi:MAG: wax ester/triacylglycerol synthase family O-acyltransferase, partial [Rhodococcus sp.]|nr:wax ester/triacylglycerol synthase family O-acyltransferase [Rhodococcus sp. (in: high G+C Gram-positive bacteria)]